LDASQAREEREAAQEEEQKVELLQDLSNREKEMFENLQAKMKADLDSNKDLGRDLGVTDSSKADVAYAIYDGGDAKSKNNQIVKRI